jgi:hypothetical protein
MARGFESKDVEYQQAERERTRRDGSPAPAQRTADSRRGSLELALSRMRADLTRAHVAAHRAMIEQAIASLEAELAALPGQQ